MVLKKKYLKKIFKYNILYTILCIYLLFKDIMKVSVLTELPCVFGLHFCYFKY